MDKTLENFPLLRLLRQGSDRFGLELVAVTILCGLSNALLLAIINDAASNAANDVANGRSLGMFTIMIVLYVYTQHYVLMTGIVEVEKILHGIRVRLSDCIRRSDLVTLEGLGRADIYASLNRQTQTISQSTPILIIAGQAALMVLFSVVYLLYLSTAAFVLAFAITWMAVAAHLRQARELNRDLQAATAKENEFFDSLTHLLDGFKEVKLSEARGSDLFANLTDISRGLEALKTHSGTGFARHFLFAQTAFYLLIASLVFLLPRVTPAYSDVVVKATAAILFIIGPLGGIVNAIPTFTTANVAAEAIARLARSLESSDDAAPGAPLPVIQRFSSIRFTDVVFEYRDEKRHEASFSLGPLDLRLTAGETLFIVGGNGSGKSTVLKLLTGLYHPERGRIQVDGKAVGAGNVAWYRSHFAAVFSDYHLFDRLYGLANIDPRRVESLLTLMELGEKTQYLGGRFTHTDLSSGQKKRLALVAALLEDRPILVLDEWAADQDPTFRRYFYEELLASQKRQGKTIVAVTHDDRYFSHADRIVKMEYGQFVPYEGD